MAARQFDAESTRFADMLPHLNADPNTEAIILIGEIGGAEEEAFAEALRALGRPKPVFALIAGQSAREGVTMGHAGALIQGDAGTVQSKTAALKGAGAEVFHRIQDLVDAVALDFGRADRA